MARIKGGLNAKKKHKRVLKLAKGYRGARSKQYRVAKQSVMRALAESYKGRKQRKRDFRKLWIARINAAARLNGLSYSKLMYGLKLAEVDLNRKVLSEMAINDAKAFADVCDTAKKQLGITSEAPKKAAKKAEKPAEKKAEKPAEEKREEKAAAPAQEKKEEKAAEPAEEKAEEAPAKEAPAEEAPAEEAPAEEAPAEEAPAEEAPAEEAKEEAPATKG